jgi:TonB-dependent starch-binding outer membrane protein SusC
MALGPSSGAQSISLSLRQEPIENAFGSIEAQTKYRFVYGEETVSRAKPLTLSLSNVSLEEALSKIFAGQPLSYSVEDQYIMVKAGKENRPIAFDVTGQVIDEEGKPLQGVTVTDKRSSKNTITDDRGEFILKDINEHAVLIFSFIGRETIELPVAGKNRVSVRMNMVSKTLDETIIQAYGTTTRRLSTGDITKVTSEEISKQAITNPLAALEARVPGMIVTQSSGVAGSNFTVQVRGRTAIDPSITDDQPLFIIDGVPYAPNNNYLNTMNSALGTPFNSNGTIRPGGLSPFASINPEDIESIEILKDADATAIYGSRGANGVVLITTKKGTPGKTKFNFDLQDGIGRPTRTIDMMTTSQYLQMRRKAFLNDSLASPGAGIAPTDFNAYDLLLWDTSRYTNLGQLLTGERAHFFNAQASVSGGNVNTQFMISGGYRRETSVFVGSPAFAQSSVLFNLAHASDNRRLKLVLSGNYSSGKNESYATDLTSLLDLPPNILIYDSSGATGWNEKGFVSSWNNPLALTNDRYTTTTDNLIANLGVDYRITKGLMFKFSSGYNSLALDEQKINPLSAQNPLQNIGRSASFSSRNFKSYIIEPHFSYLKVGRRGKLDALLGASWQYQSTDLIAASGSGYADDILLNSLAGATSVTATKSLAEYKYVALFGRVIYSRSNKYIVNLSMRRDGSSRFGPNKQFANFGSFGGAWIFSNEKWFSKNFSFLSFGKIRGSAGITGNDKIADYLYLDTWKPAQNTYQGGTALVPAKLFNPDYRWEKTTKMELAMDLGFFGDRLLLSAAYYRDRSSNQLINYKLPTTSGFTGIVQNLNALVQNKGVELTLSSTPVESKKLNWNTSINITIPRTTLLRFPGLSSSSYANTYVIGQPLNLIYGYRYLGIDPLTGLYMVEDKSKDSAFSAADRQPLGSLDPKFYGGFANTVQIGNWRLNTLLQFTSQTGVSFVGNLSNVPGSIRNMPAVLLQSADGDASSRVQRFTQNTSASQPAYLAYSRFRQSNGIYDDASFIRVKTVTISYILPRKMQERIGLRQSSVYLSAQNLFTITSYRGGDPETQNYLRLAPLRTLVAGVRFSL